MKTPGGSVSIEKLTSTKSRHWWKLCERRILLPNHLTKTNMWRCFGRTCHQESCNLHPQKKNMESENHPEMKRKNIWTKASFLASMLVFQRVPSLLVNSDSKWKWHALTSNLPMWAAEGWFVVLHALSFIVVFANLVWTKTNAFYMVWSVECWSIKRVRSYKC